MKKAPLVLSLIVLSACGSTPIRYEPSRAGRPAPKKTPLAQTAKGRRSAPAPQVAASVTIPDEAQRALDLERGGDLTGALREYLALSVAADPSKREGYRLKSLDLLESRLNEGQLREVSGDSDFGFLRGHALFRLGQISLQRRETNEARRYFSGVVGFLPGSDLAARAQEALEQLESLRSVEPKTIGVVLPLSGKNAVVGQRALRAVEMGLGLSEANSNFKLAVMDSEGNPDKARRGVERLVKEDNVIAVVGSLLSKTAPAVAAKAGELGVPVIGLSQRAGLTEAGPMIFRNALTSEMQVRQLVHSAMRDLGMRRFAILAPNDSYGVEYANIFWDEVLARGGVIAAAQFYDPKETDFRGACQRLVGTWYIEGREDEYKLLLKEQAASGGRKKSSRREKSADDILPPIVDFDAVFIPDSAKMMTTLAAFLSYAGVRDVKLLGTNLWNISGVAKKAGLFSDRLVFVDSWKAEEDTAKAPRFIADYKRLFGESPTLIEIQAYDSALILRSLVLQGATSRESLIRRLTDLNDFPGILGPLSMSSQREVRRPLITYSTSGGAAAPLTVR